MAHHKRKKRNRGLLLLLLLTLFAVAGLGYMLRVSPKEQNRTIELGQVISHAPQSYLNGNEYAMKLAKVDTSGVNTDEVGNYPVVVKYLAWEYPFTIHIVDTQAPNMVLQGNDSYVALGRSYDITDFVKEVTDNSIHVTVSTLEDGSDTVVFQNTGVENLTLVARDDSGNETQETLTLNVENAPEITGIKDYYITPDATPDYLYMIEANDIEDGDLTESLQIHDEQVRTDQDGEYPLYYEVTDSNGVSTVNEALVTVCNTQELEQKVGDRSVDVIASRVRGIPNFRDMGESTIPNMDQEKEYIVPTLVYFKFQTPYVKGNGSGFIISITDDYVDICSNEHVLKYGADAYSATFADADPIRPVEILGLNEQKDIGFARVRRENIPDDVYERLMSVHISETDWNNIQDDGRDLFMVCIGENGKPDIVKSGSLIARDSSAKPYHDPDVTEFTISVIHGNSGSPVFDAYGHLNSMAFAYLTQPDGISRRFGVRLNDIVEEYQKITGNDLYTY